MHLSTMKLALLAADFSAPSMADVIISQYVEGSSLNKVIELYNAGTDSADLSEYSLAIFSNGNASPSQSTSLSGTLAAGDALVIGSVANFGGDSAVIDLDYELFHNGNDVIALSRNGEFVDVMGQIGDSANFAKDVTLRRGAGVNTGDADGSDAFSVGAEWVECTSPSKDDFSGLGEHDIDEPCSGGHGGPGAEVLSIMAVQGASHQSPYVGQTVTVQGVVTAVQGSAFYLQDASGDGNLRTSDAILVFGSGHGADVGDELEVTGQVTEYTPGGSGTGNLSTTELTSPQIALLSTGNALPAPLQIGEGFLPPTAVIDSDGLAVFNPETDAIDWFEALEAMRVSVQQPLVIGPTDKYTETWVIPSALAAERNARGGVTIADGDYKPYRIQVDFDDRIYPGETAPVANVGDTLSGLTGVIGYDFGSFQIHPSESYSVNAGGLTPETTSLTGDAEHLTIATFNVLNLDPNDNDADTDIANGQFSALAQQIVSRLQSPDIIALQEIQDNDGVDNTAVVDGDQTGQLLIDTITAAGGPAYTYAELPPVDDAEGGWPGGNIRVAYLYRSDRAALVAGSLERLTDNAFNGSRVPLMAEFVFNDETLRIINNHFSSKGGSTPLFGQVQPPVNGSEDERQAQAEAVNSAVDAYRLIDEEAKIVVLGDLNEFQFMAPIQALADGVLLNLTDTLPAKERYSYIYQGNSQALDHILVTQNLSDVVEYDVVHVNAEFANQASDHDPAVIRLQLGQGQDPTARTCQGKVVTVDLAKGEQPTTGDDVIRGTSGDDVVNGRGGNDYFCGRGGNDTYRGGDGVDSVSGGAGDDLLILGGGNDFAWGDKGNDTIRAGAGDDAVRGGKGNDEIKGGDGNDEIKGGDGNDELRGGDGDDVLLGQAGEDTINGQVGDDEIHGGADNDTLHGGQGDDDIRGNAGEDQISGGNGDDLIEGNSGDDIIFGNGGDDVLFGNGGDDQLTGNGGADQLHGGAGTDTCDGNRKDTLQACE